MKNFFKTGLELMLKNLSRKILNKSNAEIIGVTGSVGKSSTKEAIFKVLNESQKYKNRVAKSEGNLNNEIGLPLSILGFKRSPKWYEIFSYMYNVYIRANYKNTNPLKDKAILVLEYAADKPGDMDYLVSIAKPKIAIITKISPAHLELFGTIDNVIKEKGRIAEILSSDGTLFLNKDDKNSSLLAKKTSAKVIYFKDTGLNLYREIAENVGKYYEISNGEIKKALYDFKLPAGRLSIFSGIKNSTIIDSSYNASPDAVKLTLNFLRNYNNSGRKVAILGDMRELGEFSEKAHKGIAYEIIENADVAILIGPQMQKWVKPILDENHFINRSFINFRDAKSYIVSSVKENDIILVKGSQNTLCLERVVELLLKNKNDIQSLCRRGSGWDKIRKRTL
jgi:UDP-N-acetylmuramoyl-tripeptide--D-alanyl-D-alanine ligase